MGAINYKKGTIGTIKKNNIFGEKSYENLKHSEIRNPSA